MHDWVLAIDFGTSFTVAASRTAAQPPEVLEIDGERRTPSVLLVSDDGQIVVGRPAVELAVSRPHRAVRAVKLRLGDPAPVVVAGESYPAASLAAELLAKVYDEAVRHHDGLPREVRLTHPAAWGPDRREQLVRAATLAGLSDPQLVSEPVAAAIAYSDMAALTAGHHVLVYDLGGGTLDLALLRTTEQGFELVGRPGGDPQLGGELFDELVAAELGSRLSADVWEHLQFDDDPAWRQAAGALAREARRAKELLSTHPRAEVLLPLPTGLVTATLDRRDFDELVQPSLTMSARLAAHLVTSAGLDPSELDAIFLAGGATRSPGVVTAIEDALPGVPLSRRGDPKAAVALGATHPLVVGSWAHDHDRRRTDGVSTIDREDPTLIASRSAAATAPGDADAASLPGPNRLAPSLVVIAGPDAGRRFALGDRMVIGRSPTASISLSDPALSRQHALISCLGDAVFVEDAGSRNGTAVDGEPVTAPRRLVVDDLIEVGATLLRFEVAGAPAAEVDPTTPFEVDRLLVTPVPAPPKLSGRPDAARAADVYRAEVAAIAAELRAAARQEGSRRERRSPGIADLLGRAERGETARVARPRLHPEFLSVRVGWGETSVLPRLDVGTGGDPGLRSWAMSVVATAAVVAAAPIVISLEDSPLVVVIGDAALAAGGARWLMAQVVALHRPHDVAVRVATDDPQWAWLGGLPHVVGPADEPDPAMFTVTLTDRWPLAAPAGHDVPAMSTVVLLAPSVPTGVPDGAITLAYQPRPARVVIDGVADGAPIMADVLTPELARTLGAALARQAS